MTTNERTVGRYLRWLLAALSLGAGVIHFAVSGEHYEVSWDHGTFFAVVAWLQLSWAVGVVVRPTRGLLAAGAILNAGILGVWAVSRVWGVPIGPDAFTPEAVGWSDALSSVCELGIVALALGVIVRPEVAQRRLRPSVAVPVVGIAGLGVAVISSLAFTPALAASHHHGEADGSHTHSAAPSGHEHGSAVSGHQHGPTTLNGEKVKGVKAQDVAAESQPNEPLDATTRATLKTQLSEARDFALRYPTVADAAQPDTGSPAVSRGSGAHYISYGGIVGSGSFDPMKVNSLIYDGTSPTSQIVGLMYYGMGQGAPEGFAGPNDHWHRHSNVCIKPGPNGIDVPFPADQDVTANECAAVQGSMLKTTGYMVHAWVVPSGRARWACSRTTTPTCVVPTGPLKRTRPGSAPVPRRASRGLSIA